MDDDCSRVHVENIIEIILTRIICFIQKSSTLELKLLSNNFKYAFLVRLPDHDTQPVLRTTCAHTTHARIKQACTSMGQHNNYRQSRPTFLYY